MYYREHFMSKWKDWWTFNLETIFRKQNGLLSLSINIYHRLLFSQSPMRPEIKTSVLWQKNKHLFLAGVSHCVFSGPFFGALHVFADIGLVETSNLGDQWVVGIGITEKWTNWEKNLSYCQSRWPLGSENVETNSAIAVNIRVIDSGCERELGWFEGIIRGEVNI